MTKKDFRPLQKEEAQAGTAIWLQGKSFLDTSPISPSATSERQLVCGPFLVERVLHFDRTSEPRVDLVDTATGERRSMMCSWLLIPKEL